jgi:hypothetical protein
MLGDILCCLSFSGKDYRTAMMIDLPCQLECPLTVHAGNGRAKETDDLLVRVAITVIDRDARFEGVTRSGGDLFSRFWNRYRGRHISHLFIVPPEQRGAKATLMEVFDVG